MIRIYSRLLGEDIVCAEDAEAVEAGSALVSYTRTEMNRLRGLPPEDVRAIHAVKKAFGGRYLGPSTSTR